MRWLLLPVEIDQGDDRESFYGFMEEVTEARSFFCPSLTLGLAPSLAFFITYYFTLFFFYLIEMTSEYTKHCYNLMNSIILVKKKKALVEKKENKCRHSYFHHFTLIKRVITLALENNEISMQFSSVGFLIPVSISSPIKFFLSSHNNILCFIIYSNGTQGIRQFQLDPEGLFIFFLF